MLPYYSFPFSYIDRNSMMMPGQAPQIPLPTALQPIQMEQEPGDMSMPQMPDMQSPLYNMPNYNMPNYNMPNYNMPAAPMPQMQPVIPMPNFPNPAVMPNMNGYGMANGFTPHTERPEDRAPFLSNNPPVTAISLFKELTAYPNYGNPSGNADILYTRDRGTWTFDVPAFLFVPGNLTGQIIIRGVLDDMEDVPANRYSARITINGTVVHTGRLPLVHGRPVGGQFNNWREMRFDIPNFRRNNRVVIENTSNAGSNNWIAFDWMDLRLSPR